MKPKPTAASVAIQAAVSNRRPELLQVLTAPYPHALQEELLKALSDLIQEHADLEEKHRHLVKRVQDSVDNISGAVDALENAVK